MKDTASNMWRDYCRLFAVASSVFMVTSLVVVASDDSTEVGLEISFSRPNQRVDDGSADSRTPDIASDEDGVLHAVWSDNRDGYWAIYHSRSADHGSSWSISTKVSAGVIGSNSRMPSIAIDKTGGSYLGQIYVAWHEAMAAGGVHIFAAYSSNSGATWSSPLRLDTAPQTVQCLEPDIAVDSLGNVYVVWYDDRDPASFDHILVSVSDNGGFSFRPEVQVTTQNAINQFPCVTATSDKVLVCWREQDVNDFVTLWIASSSDSGLTWIPRVLFAGSYGSDSRFLETLADAKGTLHAIWAYEHPSGEEQISYSKSGDGGGSWSNPVKVDDYLFSTAFTRPSVASGPRGLYVTWSDNRAGDQDIYFSYSKDGGLTWGDGIMNSNDVRVDDTDENGNPSDDSSPQSYPSMALGTFGSVTVWEDFRSGSSYDIYSSSYSTEQILITEMRDAPEGAEIIEIYNFGSQSVDMNGYTLQIDDSQVYPLGAIGTLPPLQYRTIGDNASADLVLSLNLDDQGGELFLFDPDTRLIDLVAYGQKGTVPDPLAGESVARRRVNLDYKDEWVREKSPTFGADNDVPGVERTPNVVINEVLFYPNASDEAFVEVYYLGTESVFLSGYKVVCNRDFTIGGIILTESNPYYALRYQMDSGFFDSMSSQQDNVYLYDSKGQLLDMVGWSSFHTQGTSMTRAPDGNGTFGGFNDLTSEEAGWKFDSEPTLPLVVLGPDQSVYVDVGQRILLNLTVTNKQILSDYIDIIAEVTSDYWIVEILREDGIFLLVDSPGDGDGIPDSGLLSPEESLSFKIGVTIPSDPPIGSFQVAKVIGTASSDPLASDSASISLKVYPHIEPLKNVAPAAIYHEDAGPGYPTIATVRLSVSGNGSAVVRSVPQDVIFLIDKSGSMANFQKFTYAKLGAKSYVDDMRPPDRGAVIFFDEFVTRLNPLSTDYAQIKADIDSIVSPGGWTAIGAAINACWNDLDQDGDPAHLWVCILLTDGMSNSGPDPITEAQNAAAKNVVIYAIGLAPDADNVTLQNVATITGGEYFYAESPEDLVGIYKQIGAIIDQTAGRDLDVSDNIPMIEDVIPPYIHPVAGSFKDPSTGLPRLPDYLGSRGTFTILQWNISSLLINETWEVEYDISADQVGIVPVGIYPDARVAYVRWDGNETYVPFPNVLITVTYYTAPPKNVETFWDGENQIGLRWVEVPWPELDHYLIYKADSQNEFQDLSPGAAYNVVPAGTTEWTDPEAGGAASHDGEHYYLIRAANANESDVSETSNTAGAWTKTFAAGFSTFSIPLDYFPWAEYDGAARIDTVQEYSNALGAEYIEYMESEHWLRVPGAGDPLKRMNVGEGSVISLGSNKRFTFVGLPGSMIKFDEHPFAGFDLADNAKSIELSVSGNDIRVDWIQPIGADAFDIYYASARAGFYSELGTDYWLLLGSFASPGGPTATVFHVNALLEPYDEFYYMILPINNSVGLGSASYSSGIWLGRFDEGYHAVALPLKPFSNGQFLYHNVSFYADHIPETLVVLWYKDSESRWIPHIPAMERGTYDTEFGMFLTLKVNVSSDIIFGFAGV